MPLSPSLSLALSLSLTLSLLACGGGDTHAATGTTGSGGASTTSSGTGAGGCQTTDPGSDGKPLADPESPCKTLEAAGEPSERVVFVDRAHDSNVSNPIEIMYAWRYAARAADGDPGTYRLEEEQCSTPAGGTETCNTIALPKLTAACSGPIFGPKFAVDDTQYKPGDNVYRITIRMKRGCDVVSSDAFTFHVNYAPPP